LVASYPPEFAVQLKKPTPWSLYQRSDLVPLAVGSAVGIGNFLVLPSLVLYSGGVKVVLLHVLCLFLLGAPLVVAEFLWSRWLLRPYAKAWAVTGPGTAWLGSIAYFAIAFVASTYLLEMGRLLLLGVRWMTESGYPVPAYREQLTRGAGRWASYGGGAALLSLIAWIASGPVRKLARAMRTSLVVAFSGWAFLAIWVLQGWGTHGLRRLLYWDSTAIDRAVLTDNLALSLFSLSAGFGILYTFLYYASLKPVREEGADGDRAGRILRTAGWILLGDLLASMASLLCVSPIALGAVGTDVALASRQSSAQLLLDWLPQIFVNKEGGPAMTGLLFLSLLAAGTAAFLSLFEVAVFALERELSWTRRKAVLHVYVLGLCLLALPLVPGLEAWLDMLGSGILLPLSAGAIAWAVGWRMPLKAQQSLFGRGLLLDPLFLIWRLSIRYLVPAGLAFLLLRRTGLF